MAVGSGVGVGVLVGVGVGVGLPHPAHKLAAYTTTISRREIECPLVAGTGSCYRSHYQH